eukprot:Blabericola_migrator_1__265@NODE_106_length_14174_cov_318_190118_g94_i0_p6_GENE_NODE_106_length_14174_cov_318_190118_g94_i0NODE_106_length_14174_cov_318_190118_g94_i0_p6_ORF_typecomplete_len347_score54_88zfCCCH/PF00642_24/1_3e06zfCCCH/PF00642_24/2_3e07zfCCCH_3/PF15663_5/3e07Torus/PF16131_5/0_00052Torus/PF16131_5/0_05zf_CCCH_4/PF18345_1/0_0071zf_CCCH_4/PF18345_1/0_0053zfCCCH_4/PF18044_1/0_88zfCCCH_4/PF18044_1/0_025zfCCCH_2/PF14608_6/5_1zfCCCH_2/PF14608_6/2_9Gal11_ABD1/PF18535_1/0_14_NODE_106_leng
MSTADVRPQQVPAVSLAIAQQRLPSTGDQDSASPTHGGTSSKRRRGAGRRLRKNNRASSALQSRMLKTKLCRWMSQGRCEKGAECSFAHSESELRECPDLTKTRMCASFEQRGTCGAGDKCRFAHTEDELRGTDDLFGGEISPRTSMGNKTLTSPPVASPGKSASHNTMMGSTGSETGALEPTLLGGQSPASLTSQVCDHTSISSTTTINHHIVMSPTSSKETAATRSSRASTASWDSVSAADCLRETKLDEQLPRVCRGDSQWWSINILNALMTELSASISEAMISHKLMMPTPLQVTLIKVLMPCATGQMVLSEVDMQCIQAFYRIHQRLQQKSSMMLDDIVVP